MPLKKTFSINFFLTPKNAVASSTFFVGHMGLHPEVETARLEPVMIFE
jgi:hypothetical protein